MSPADFEEQIAWLAQHRSVMPMESFVEGLDRGRLPRGAVAITFDDGYLDNLLNAQPTLQRFGVPATLFLATGYVAAGSSYWWDRLADAILASPGGADWTLSVGGQQVSLSWEDSERANPNWRASHSPTGRRERAFLEIWTILQRLSPPARDEAMRQIAERHPSSPEENARAMRVRELQQLISEKVFTLGSHSVTHPALATLDEPSLRHELEVSRDACTRLIRMPVAGFAYPYGNMSGSVRAAVAAAGYSWACSTEAGTPPFKPSAEARFSLPRIIPPTGGAQALAHVLREI